MIETKICNCGGNYINRNGKWQCDSCSRPMPQIKDTRENQLLTVAEGKFAQEKFIEAEELYGEIVKSFPECYSAYWGLALAKHGIKYVDDLRTGKKVATCWAPEISSIKEDKNYRKVLSLVPSAEKEYYEKKALAIEKIRLEWQEKAKKIKPYDVFICFKDTDDETKSRTQDSIELADLYNNLTRDKYNVFFSRYSLDGIAAENYEPYIFQALATAKVMIVYGSKEEYFESTWMKNEWTRFSYKISEGQKQKNSLLPVVKGCNPNALPPRLRTLQVLDASKNTFYSDLTRYIDKVLSMSESTVELQRNKVKFDKRHEVKRQQARKIEARSLQTVDEIENISAQGEQLMRVIDSFVQQGQFQRAEKFCDTWIKSNPSNYRDLEELVRTILIAHNVKLAKKYIDYIVDMAPQRKMAKLWHFMVSDGFTQISDWIKSSNFSQHISLDYLQEVLPLISENEVEVLYECYEELSEEKTFSEDLKNMILYTLEYEVDLGKKNEFIKSIVNNAILDSTDNYAYFDFVITLLNASDYNRALINFVNTHIDRINISALIKILPLLEGECYSRAHFALITMYFDESDFSSGVAEAERFLATIDNEFEYLRVLDDTISVALKCLKPTTIVGADEYVYRLLGFKNKTTEKDGNYFAILAQLCCDGKYRDGVDKYAKLLLGCGAQGKYLGYYYLMLLDLNCFNSEDVARLKIDIADTDSYNTWLANCEGEYLNNATMYLKRIDEIREELRKQEAQRKLNKKLHREHVVESGKKYAKTIIKYCCLFAISIVAIVLSIVGAKKYQIAEGGKVAWIAIFLIIPTIGAAGAALYFYLFKRKDNDELIVGTRRVLLAVVCGFFILNIIVFLFATSRYGYTDDGLYVKRKLDGNYTLCGIKEEYNYGEIVIPKEVNKITRRFGEQVKAEKLSFESRNSEYELEMVYEERYLLFFTEGYRSVFEFNDYIKKIVLPHGITKVGRDTFKYCSSLTSIEIPSSVTIIGERSFSGCSSLTSIEIPSSVTSIGEVAFGNCTSLKSVEITNYVTYMGNSVFEHCDNITIYCEAESLPNTWNKYWKGSGNVVWGWKANGVLESGLKWMLTSSDTIKITGYSGSSNQIVIPSKINGHNVTSIGEQAFNNCRKITDIVLPDTIVEIGEYAFNGCSSLTKIVIPISVTKIGKSAFASCSDLTIYCEAESAPSGWINSMWNGYWNSSKCPVIWGYNTD